MSKVCIFRCIKRLSEGDARARIFEMIICGTFLLFNLLVADLYGINYTFYFAVIRSSIKFTNSLRKRFAEIFTIKKHNSVISELV